MKKGIILILMIVFLTAVLAGCGTADDAPANVLKNEEFSVTVPEEWVDLLYVEITETEIRLYQKAAYESFSGGFLCSISKVEDYTVYPSYELLGEAEGMYYIAQYPSDVQANVLNEESMSEYFSMFEQLPEVVKTFEVL